MKLDNNVPRPIIVKSSLQDIMFAVAFSKGEHYIKSHKEESN